MYDIEKKVKLDQEENKLHCERCLTPLNDPIPDTTPIIHICPNPECGVALDEYGFIWDSYS